MKARVFCVCGHEVEYHSATSGRCLLQEADGGECPCTEPRPARVLFGDAVYDLVLVTPTGGTDNGA